MTTITRKASEVLRELPEEQWTATAYWLSNYSVGLPDGMGGCPTRTTIGKPCMCATGYLAYRSGLPIESGPIPSVRKHVDDAYALPAGTARQCEYINDTKGLAAVISYLEGIGR